MKKLLLLTTILFCTSTHAQTTFDTGTSRRFATATFNGLGTPSPGEVRQCIDCTKTDPTTGGAAYPGALVKADGTKWYSIEGTGGGGGTGDVVGPASSTDSELLVASGLTGKLLKRSNTLTGYVKVASGVVTAAAIPSSDITASLGFTPENSASKDTTGGYAGLTLYKIDFKNAANTFTNFFTNATTAARTYTFQDRDGTVADNTDLALKAPLASPTFTGTVGLPAGTVLTTPALTFRTQANNTAIVANSPYRNTGDDKLYIGNNAGTANREIFEAGVSLVNLASNVTGTLPVANGGTGVATLTGIPKASGTSAFVAATAGTDYTTPSSTESPTNKSFDAEATGNTLTQPFKTWFASAGCVNATAASFWDLGTSLAPTPTCKNSSSGAAQNASLDFPDSDGMYFAQTNMMLPEDFTGTVDAKIRWMAAATSGDVIWNVATVCVADGAVDNPAFSTASTVTDTAKGTTLQSNDATITAVTITGCSAGNLMHIEISRQRTTSGDTITGVVSFLGLQLTTRRAQ